MNWPFPPFPRPMEPAAEIPFDLDDVEDAPL
jgi:hypothetical protein